jgi:hypothetical protein
MDQAAMEDYTGMLTADQSFDLPPVVVFHEYQDGWKEKYWLADGWHRHGGYLNACRKDIPVRVIEGTWRDALRYSLSANATHGLRRTNADIERAVLTALKDDEWAHWSDSEVARLCAVNQTTVSRHRAKLMQSISAASVADGQAAPAEAIRTYRTRGGKTATMNVANIGRRKTKARSKPAAAPAPPPMPDLFTQKASYGAGEAARTPYTLLRPDVTEVLETFGRLKTDEARAAFADKWISLLARRLDDSWPALYELLRIVRDRGLYRDAGALGRGKSYGSFADYFADTLGEPFDTWAELEQTHHFVRDIKPELFGGTPPVDTEERRGR